MTIPLSKHKQHFRAEMTENGTFRFRSHNGETAYFAGGSASEPNFLIKKLIELHGKKEGLDVYQKMMNAMVQLGKDWTKNNSKYPCGSIVVYRKPE